MKRKLNNSKYLLKMPYIVQIILRLKVAVEFHLNDKVNV